MAVIDGVFCLNARVIYKREMLSVVTLDWSGILWTIYHSRHCGERSEED